MSHLVQAPWTDRGLLDEWYEDIRDCVYVQSVDDTLQNGDRYSEQWEEYGDEKNIFRVGWSPQKFAGSLAARQMTSGGVTHRPDSR